MAEAVVSVALETFRDLLLEEASLLSGVGDEVKALETQLKEMKCLLEDADRRQHESKSIANWIAEIRDLAYRSEDVIETYSTEVSSKRGRALKRLLCRFSCIMKEFHSLHQLGFEISQIKSKLARVGKSMQDYGIRNIIQGETSSSGINQQWKRQTFPHFQIEDCFVGKDDELKRIVSLVVDNDQHRVVSIWGMGGLGKTTIARKVYNHVDTKRYFQSFAWVCITQQCQIRAVLEDVLKQLNPLKRDVVSNSSLSNTELIEELCQIQKAKRCIIVLDDVWETDHWDGLKHAFLVEDLKSKILVTTRKKRVAEIGFSVPLGLLNSESGLELLKKKAFPVTNTPDFAFDENLLRKIGKEMVQKCGFLPLTISLLGGLLSKRKSTGEWELVKENINTYLYKGDGIEMENEMQAVFNLSYEDLPYYLKPCFLYLGLLINEDKSVRATYVYNTWIAQGMVSHGNREDESLAVIAQFYLSELASRSIVQVEVLDEGSMSEKRYSWCKLHDVVRELCLSIAKRENFGVQSLVYQDGKLMHGSLSGAKTRHLAIHFEEQNGVKIDGGEFGTHVDEDTYKNVRSLLLLNSNEKEIEFLDIAIDLQIFKLLKVLIFCRLRFERKKVSKGIGNLIHLRFLSFRHCELDELPSSIRNLSYLQTLDLSTSREVRVPNVLNKLPRLKHLMLPLYSKDRVGNYALELDEGLDELETLTGFDSSVHRLKSITRLKNLKSFKATVRDNESLLAVIDAVTTEWNKLQHFSLVIREGCELTSTDEGLMVLEKVLTYPNLHQLTAYVEIGKRLGECKNHVSSSQIVELSLWGCKIEDDPMEILGKLLVLKKLDLWMKSFVGKEMTCSAFSFPRLMKLRLDKLPNLEEWRVEEGAMPFLSKITIQDCPNLMMLPDGLRFISSLQTLVIIEMPGLGIRVLASEEDGAEGEGEEFDKVRHVPSIIINN